MKENFPETSTAAISKEHDRETLFDIRQRYTQALIDSPKDTPRLLDELQTLENTRLGIEQPVEDNKQLLWHREPARAEYESTVSVSSTAFAAGWHKVYAEVLKSPLAFKEDVRLQSLNHHPYFRSYASDEVYHELLLRSYTTVVSASNELLVAAAEAKGQDPQDPEAIFWESLARVADNRSKKHGAYLDYLETQSAGDESYVRPRQQTPWDLMWYNMAAENTEIVLARVLLPFYFDQLQRNPAATSDDLFAATLSQLERLERPAAFNRQVTKAAWKNKGEENPLRANVIEWGKNLFSPQESELWVPRAFQKPPANPSKCSGFPTFRQDKATLRHYYQQKGVTAELINMLPDAEMSSLGIALIDGAALIRDMTKARGKTTAEVWF
ncbi:MAG TPA: hypothetical protein VD907_02605 [Verrucomicrobiae bacterium]|nr:hypothetical protein [Verrucomicrobiae bacterium]